MSFKEALVYPFKRANITKIFIIFLTFLISMTSLANLSIFGDFANDLSNLIFLPVLGLYGLFICGYMISVLRSVMDGEQILPAVNLMRDLGRGIVVVLAGIVYAIPFIIAEGFFKILETPIGAMIGSNGAILLIPYFLAIFLIIFAGFSLVSSYIVALLRYAAENRIGALFNFTTNFRTVTANSRKTIELCIRQFGLFFLCGCLIMLIAATLIFFFWDTIERSYDFPDELLYPFWVTICSMILSCFIFLVSSIHLCATFGTDISIGTRKAKNDE